MCAGQEAIAFPVVQLDTLAFLDDPLKTVQYRRVGEPGVRRPNLMPLGVHFLMVPALTWVFAGSGSI